MEENNNILIPFRCKEESDPNAKTIGQTYSLIDMQGKELKKKRREENWERLRWEGLPYEGNGF